MIIRSNGAPNEPVPDLGAGRRGRYSDEWHVQHLIDPRSVVPESIMPPYAFLAKKELKSGDMVQHLRAQRRVGVPYTRGSDCCCQ